MNNLNNKLRLRNEEELRLQNEGLKEAQKVLGQLGIPYYLSSGTLLGAVVTGNFFPWDWDVQFYLTTETAFPIKEQIINKFVQHGFELSFYDPFFRNLKYVFIKYNTRYEITAWWQKGKMRYRGKYSQIPAYLFENPAKISFLGENYPCMTPANEYFDHCYSDWKTPKQISDKSKYLSPKFFKYPLWLRIIIEKKDSINRIVKKILFQSPE